MTPRVSKLYEGAKKNKEFLADLLKADGDKAPSVLADNETKVLFSSVYYGWLILKYRDVLNWEDFI
jgi:hypothetical protein